MMVQRGYLLPGSVPLSRKTHNAVRAGTAWVDGSEIEVVAKALPEAEIDIEVFCAVLAVLWELPALSPLVLTDESGALYFACSRSDKSNIMQVFDLEKVPEEQWFSALRPLANWKAAPKVCAFDEAIDNVDRNLGNILWTDENDFLLIDHGLALGNKISPSDTENKLLTLVRCLHTGNDLATQKLKKDTLTAAKQLDEDRLDDAKNSLTSEPDTADHVAFVRVRLQSLADLIKSRFPNGQLPIPPVDMGSS